ncbi:hypothetical protein Tco_0742601 [Tanacetum coccineum]
MHNNIMAAVSKASTDALDMKISHVIEAAENILPLMHVTQANGDVGHPLKGLQQGESCERTSIDKEQLASFTMQGMFTNFINNFNQNVSRFVTVVKQRHEIDTVPHITSCLTPQNLKDRNAPSNKQSSSHNDPTATTRHKGKEIGKPVTPQSESVSEEDSDPEQARRDKDMQRTCTPWLSVPLQAEQAEWLEDTDEEIDEQELEAHYSYMAKIQEVSPAESSSTDTPLEQVQNHDENDVFANVRRHSEQPESINDTYVLEKDDSNVIPDSSNICTNDNQVDQNASESTRLHALIPIVGTR